MAATTPFLQLIWFEPRSETSMPAGVAGRAVPGVTPRRARPTGCFPRATAWEKPTCGAKPRAAVAARRRLLAAEKLLEVIVDTKHVARQIVDGVVEFRDGHAAA